MLIIMYIYQNKMNRKLEYKYIFTIKYFRMLIFTNHYFYNFQYKNIQLFI